MTPVGCQLAAPNLSTDSHKTLRLTTCGSKAIPRIHLAKLQPELSNIQLFDSQIDNLQQTCGSPERHHDTCRLPTYSPKTLPQTTMRPVHCHAAAQKPCKGPTMTCVGCQPTGLMVVCRRILGCRLATYRSWWALSIAFGRWGFDSHKRMNRSVVKAW